MRFRALLVLLSACALLGGCVAGTSHRDGLSNSPTEPSTSDDMKVTNPVVPQPYLRNLTWYLDTQGRMGPGAPADGKIVLSGGSDPTHARDLIQFVGEPYPLAQRLAEVAVHLIFESPGQWIQPQDPIECWFGWDDYSYPVQGKDPVVERLDANRRLDVRFNLTMTPGGAYIPPGTKPYFLCGIPGSQSPAQPLWLYVGGDHASHIHPRSYNWTEPAFQVVKTFEGGGQFIPDKAPAGPTASPPVRFVPSGTTIGFRAWVRSNQSQGADLDVQVRDSSGKFLAESNGPRANEALIFMPFNLEVSPGDLQLEVVNGGATPATYWFIVETFRGAPNSTTA